MAVSEALPLGFASSTTTSTSQARPSKSRRSLKSGDRLAKFKSNLLFFSIPIPGSPKKQNPLDCGAANMETTDLTLQDLVLLPRAQDGPELAALLDSDVDYTQGIEAYRQVALPWLSARTASQTAHSGGSDGGSDGVSPRARPRQERRSHTKSRRGCFHCKRRRIKVWRPSRPLSPRLKRRWSPSGASREARLTRSVLRGPAGVRLLREEGLPVRVPGLAHHCAPGTHSSEEHCRRISS